jgi:hypothetical protein
LHIRGIYDRQPAAAQPFAHHLAAQFERVAAIAIEDSAEGFAIGTVAALQQELFVAGLRFRHSPISRKRLS